MRIGQGLFRAPFVEKAHLVNATDSTVSAAPLLDLKFSPDVFDGILFKWNAGITTLLRTPMHKTIFADVEVACACPTLPLVGLPLDKVLLKHCVVPVMYK